MTECLVDWDWPPQGRFGTEIWDLRKRNKPFSCHSNKMMENRKYPALRILTPPMETPDPPSDNPGASKKVFLTPHDIPRILRAVCLTLCDVGGVGGDFLSKSFTNPPRRITSRLAMVNSSLPALIHLSSAIIGHYNAVRGVFSNVYMLHSAQKYCWWFRNPAFTSWGW